MTFNLSYSFWLFTNTQTMKPEKSLFLWIIWFFWTRCGLGSLTFKICPSSKFFGFFKKMPICIISEWDVASILSGSCLMCSRELQWVWRLIKKKKACTRLCLQHLVQSTNFTSVQQISLRRLCLLTALDTHAPRLQNTTDKNNQSLARQEEPCVHPPDTPVTNRQGLMTKGGSLSKAKEPKRRPQYTFTRFIHKAARTSSFPSISDSETLNYHNSRQWP